MSAYRSALDVDASSSDERLALAAGILASGAGVVLLEKTVALHRADTHLYCEVVDPMPSARRCEHEFEVLLEYARRMLESSPLHREG